MAEPKVPEVFELALQHHQSGRLREAERLYRQILTRQPGHAGALHYLGVIAHQVGQNDQAIDLIRRALVLDPDRPEAHGNLGHALQANGQLDEALAVFRRVLALQPNSSEAHYNLGNALKAKGHLDEAISVYRQALVLNPNHHKAHSNLGNALQAKGCFDQAIAVYREVLTLEPDNPQTHNNLGAALRARGQLDQAIAAFRQAIALKPNSPQAHCNLGKALQARGQMDEAIAVFRQAMVLIPNHAMLHAILGDVLKEKGELDQAMSAWRQALTLKPNYPEVHNNLGIALQMNKRLDEAIASFRQALAFKPDFSQAHCNLGNALKDQGQVDQAIAAYRQALTLKPSLTDAHDNLLLSLHYHPGFDASAIAQEHRQWNQQHAEPLKKFIQAHANDRSPDRRLRIGYVSPDLREHVVGQFLLPLLANHDPQVVEVFAYAHVPAPDAMTKRLATHADHWRSIVGRSDQQAAAQIREDRIDILVDLAGHTANNRLLIFARKPAPVQVTYLGYPDTTGLSAMDYRLSDAYADPPGQTEAYHSEQLMRLAPCAWCFQPIRELPVTPRQPGAIAFGCFNNFAKVTRPMLKLWSQILLAMPGSHLILKAKGLGSTTARQETQQFMAQLGIGPERLELRGHDSDFSDHLALYGQLDVILDTFPYHGTTTTCEALCTGVPVVSLAGQSHVSRVGVSLLSNVGLPELVASTPEEYVRAAVALASDLPRLKELRATLRQRMETSALMDAPRFARNVEMAYRQMWRKWCSALPECTSVIGPAGVLDDKPGAQAGHGTGQAGLPH